MNMVTHILLKEVFSFRPAIFFVMVTLVGRISLCFATTATDSVAKEEKLISDKDETKLDELVVTGRKYRIEGNKIISVPSQKEKNLSYDPASLVDMMNIPGIIGDGGSIGTIDGNSVAIFINGIRATETDIATFRTEDVVRVEYIHNPTEQEYAGEIEVINFIVKQYQAGGLTKIDLSQRIPINGDYSLSSKAVYKDMTYSAMVSGGYLRNHFGEEERTYHYKDIYYNGVHYDDIENINHSDLTERENTISTSFSARWVGKKGYVTHSAGFAWQQNPGSGSRSTEIWTPDILNSISTNTADSGISLSPQIKGIYNLFASDKFSLEARWTYKYTHNNTSSFYQSTSLDPILNGTKEDVNMFAATINPQFRVNQHIRFILNCGWQSTWYDTQYSGSNNSRIKQTRGENADRLLFYWTPTEKFSIIAVPGFRTEYWNVEGDRTECRSAITAEVYVNWSLSSKFRLSASSAYYNYPTKASEASDITLKTSDLMWIKGNPNLKSMDNWNVSLRALWLQSDMLDISLNTNWSRLNNAPRYVYQAASADMGGLIKTYTNVRALDSYSASIHLSGRFFKNKLNFTFAPILMYDVANAPTRRDKASFQLDANISYRFGNFKARMSYRKCTPQLNIYDLEEIRNNDQLNISLAWGVKDIYASLTFSNIISSTKSRTSYNSPHYSYSGWGSSWPFNVSLHFAYTISYGKKTDQSIDTGDISTGDSGALK